MQRLADKRERELQELSDSAAKAFKGEDWKRAVTELERLGDHRTKLEDARLLRARKQLDSE